MNWKPLNGNVLIRSHKKDKTDGGLYLAPSAQQPVGEVVGVSNGFYSQAGELVPTQLKVGDVVRYPEQAEEVTIDGEKFMLCHETEIKAIRVG